MECKKGKGDELLDILWRWQKSHLVENQFREHIRIVKLLKPDTFPGQTEWAIRINATGRRFQRSVDMVSLVGLVDPNRVV